MDMVADIVGVLIAGFTQLTGGLTGLVIDVFGDLVYNPTTGLTDIATYALTFSGLAIVFGLVNRFVRA